MKIYTDILNRIYKHINNTPVFMQYKTSLYSLFFIHAYKQIQEYLFSEYWISKDMLSVIF